MVGRALAVTGAAAVGLGSGAPEAAGLAAGGAAGGAAAGAAAMAAAMAASCGGGKKGGQGLEVLCISIMHSVISTKPYMVTQAGYYAPSIQYD
jgi:hypothetical protein